MALAGGDTFRDNRGGSWEGSLGERARLACLVLRRGWLREFGYWRRQYSRKGPEGKGERVVKETDSKKDLETIHQKEGALQKGEVEDRGPTGGTIECVAEKAGQARGREDVEIMGEELGGGYGS